MTDPMALNGHAARHDDATSLAEAPSADAAGGEREALERALADANDALQLAQERLREKESVIKRVLRDELIGSRARLSELERAHDERIATIRAAAATEVERLMNAPLNEAGQP